MHTPQSGQSLGLKHSELFTKTRKEAPKDEVARNAQHLIRAGYIHKEMAGVYAYLPLGFRTLEKLKSIVREEMNAIGGQELIMTVLQRQDVWERTDRWDSEKVDVWFKTALASGGEVGLGWSHEEPITDMMKNYIDSYRDLPVFVYQFETKLRNELRAKSGIMRGREFVMKDMYSYTINEESHKKFYDSVIEAYLRVFTRVGLGDKTYLTFASGGAFTQFSHEFQTETPVGEDTIYIHDEKRLAVNKEVFTDDVLAQLGLDKNDMREAAASEVGNIFSFGTAKSQDLGLSYKDATGAEVPVTLGSYGIGITRLMGLLVEVFGEGDVLVWPKEVTPFRYHLLSLGTDSVVRDQADKLYEDLTARGIEVLYDDRDVRAGEKFADSDLIGIPERLVVSPKTVASGAVEYLDRTTGTTKQVQASDL